MSRASILEMQNICIALLINDNTWIIILAHDDLVLRLQLNMVLRVQILLRMRATLIGLYTLMHETFAATLYVFTATFLK